MTTDVESECHSSYSGASINPPGLEILVLYTHYSVTAVEEGKMTINLPGDPAVVAFFNEVVSEAFETIKRNYLKNPTLSRARIYPGLAELLIYYDPKRSYKWFFYRLQVREKALWRKSFHKNQMNETPASDSALVRYDYSVTTVDHIISDFVSQYRDDWATKPLGEPPAE